MFTAECREQKITSKNTKTVFDLVQNVENFYGNQTFLRYQQQGEIIDITYEEFVESSNSVSAWMTEKMIREGRRLHVAIFGKCSYSYLAVLLGSTSAGAVAIPLDVQLYGEDLVDRLNRADTDILFYDEELSQQIEEVKSQTKNIKQFICLQNKKNEIDIWDIVEENKNKEFISLAKPEDCAVIIFTSGTTGKGKGVMLSHLNLIDNTFCTDDNQTGEVCLNVLPIHHIFCLNGDVLMVLRYGGTLCLCESVSKIFSAIQTYQPSIVRVVPMMAKVLYNKVVMTKKQQPEISLEEVKEEVLGENLHKLVSGGGYLSEDISKKFAELGIDIGQGYGMSECSPKISTPDYSRMDKLTSVGKVVDGCQVRTVDGELQVKSPSVMMGYYKDEKNTKEALTEDGWLRTGDLGYVDEENFVYLTGRKKNLIILSNGENVSPEAIENKFDGELLVSEIIVYGADEVIAAEVYPNLEYARANGITNLSEEVQKIVNKVNKTLPTFSRIAQCSIRMVPFEKTGSKKIKREAFFKKKAEEKKNKVFRKPETKMQQQIFDIFAEIMGNEQFGVDTNLYDCGLDSFGSVLFIEELHNRLQQVMTFHDLLEQNTILKIEACLTEKKQALDVDYSVREVYPLTNMQKYFAYIIKGNTTGNLPFTYKLDDKVDLLRLKKAIEGTIEAHPGLKAIIKFDVNQYKVFRDDTRKIDIPIVTLTEAEWKEQVEDLLVPYSYTAEDNLFHISLFQTETSKYLFFDVAHIMGDGITMNILFEDVNKLYRGEEIEKESYTFYEYILEEQEREKLGIRPENLAYFDELLKGSKLKRSILNKKEKEDYTDGTNAAIRQRLEIVDRKKILAFCKKIGVSENVLFLTAFNYCMALFSDEKDVFSNSIHSGRTDSRWSRMAGALFLTYYCRYTEEPEEQVEQLLKKTAKQIMDTMQCFVAAPRQGEMFFQFQGDILNMETIGEGKIEPIRRQLDSLPFHMQVMYDKEGYYTELRYWKNRFDHAQLEMFLLCYQHIIVAMAKEKMVKNVKRYLPEEVYPKHFYVKVDELNKEAGKEIIYTEDKEKQVKAYILDENHRKKPFGAWGPLYIMDEKPDVSIKNIQNPYGAGLLYGTGLIARILPDGTVDFLENSGRTVLTDGIAGRRYYDLKKAEDTLCAYEGVKDASCYLCYDKDKNEMRLEAKITAESELSIENIKAYVAERCEERLVPVQIHIRN